MKFSDLECIVYFLFLEICNLVMSSTLLFLLEAYSIECEDCPCSQKLWHISLPSCLFELEIVGLGLPFHIHPMGKKEREAVCDVLIVKKPEAKAWK